MSASKRSTPKKRLKTSIKPLLPRSATDPTGIRPAIRYEDDSAVSWTDELLNDFQDEVGDFHRLQSATGSEVVSSELLQKIDNAAILPNLFLDSYVNDASSIEKVAMSSIPEQLPKPAVEVLSASVKSRRKRGQQNSGLNQNAARITPQEELDLAKSIQRGVALHKIKTDYEAKNGKEISRQEWSKIAGLSSTNELRRGVSEYRQSKQKLVAANMGLVHAVIRSKSKTGKAKMTGTKYEELVQEGSLGLMRAAELFDPSRGIRFSTYATIWIKGMLSNFRTDEMITIPAREKTKWNKIRQAHGELSRELGRQPTHNEIAAHTGLKPEVVVATSTRMTQASQVLSLDYQYATQSRSGTESTVGELLMNNKALMEDADVAERSQMQADVVAALAKNLDAREERLMRLRYGLVDGQSRSMAQCAEAMGLSKGRVQQLAQSCLAKLRHAAEAESLQEYLLTIA
mmetsp:Transcript_2414/g.4142  ORF Transcript_2414/g.4142 Transcript_2414/m.4142 type:complete len:459 (-) Transcript_2414:39-1415(-)